MKPDIKNLIIDEKEPLLRFKVNVDGSVRLTLEEDFSIKIPFFADNPSTEVTDKECVVCTIKKGTSTNFATVPAMVRFFISRLDPVIALPSLVHDALVNEFDDSNVIIQFPDGTYYTDRISWKLAADAMLEIMKMYKGKWNYIKARWAYSGIRFHGYVKGLK